MRVFSDCVLVGFIVILINIGVNVAQDDAANDRELIINPEANLIIGTIMQVHSRGHEIFDCGTPTEQGIIQVEALKWITAMLNQEKETSFLPGITLGIKIYDTCGRFREAVNQLKVYAPSLESEENLVENSSLIYQLGLIDGADLLEDSEIKTTLVNQNIPLVQMDSEKMMILAEDRAQAMVTLAQELKWGRVFVLYDNSEYGFQMVNRFLENSKDQNLCVEGTKKLVSNEKFKGLEDDINSLTLDQTFSAIQRGTPIIVLMRRSNYKSFLEYLNNDRRSINSAKLFFSDLLTEAEFRILPKNISEMYSISFSPDHIPAFEKYWKKQIDDVKNHYEINPEDKWLKEYLNLRRNCTLKDNTESDNNASLIQCDKLMHAGLLHHNILGVTLRTIEVITASEAVLCLAEAFKQAWDSRCMNATSEPCEEVMDMSRDEFVGSYFRYPFLNNMTKDTPIFRLIKYHQIESDIIVKKIMLFNQYGKREYLAEEFQPSPVEKCPSVAYNGMACDGCNITKQTRVDGGRHYGVTTNSVQLIQTTAKLSKHQSNNQYQILVHSPQNLYIAVIMSVHRTVDDNSIHECGGDGDLDIESVRQLEAFLWALEKINFQLQQITSSNFQLGALLLDACNSKVRTLSLTSGLSQNLPGLQGYQVLVAVNALCFPNGVSANEILSALNITSIATTQSVFLGKKLNQYTFQVEAPISSMATSVVDVLKYLGWSYVSVVFSASDEEYTSGYNHFQEAAAKAGICLALEEALFFLNSSTNSSVMYEEAANLIRHLVEARTTGARAVVMWLNEVDTHIFMKAVSQGLEKQTLHKEDLFWIFCSPDGKIFNSLQQFQDVLGGALVFSPQQRSVPQFIQHLEKLHSNRTEESNRNPWLHRYYKEEDECKLFLGSRNHDDFNMIQAVYSIGAALVQSTVELCKKTEDINDKEKLCIDKHSRSEVQQIINQNVHHSMAERADTAVNGVFKFTSSGMGVITTEIFNLKHKPIDHGQFSSEIYFELVPFSNSYQNGSMVNLVSYRDNGDEIPLSGVTSQCGAKTSCPQCKGFLPQALSRDMVIIERPEGENLEKLYIGATFAIHEPSQNPLECGTDVNMQGIEEMEAFLWAVDQMNHNSSKLNLTPVVLDTCGSAVKSSRDVANFLENYETVRRNDKKGHIIGFITGSGTSMVNSVMDLVGHLGIPVLATQAGGPPPHRKKFIPYPLQLSPTNHAMSLALLSFMKHLKLTCVTVIYHQDGIEYEDMQRYLKQQSQLMNISMTISLEIGVPVGTLNVTAHLRKALGTIQRLPTIGPKVVLLLLPPDRIDLLFRTVHSLEDEGLLLPYNSVWISISGSEQVFLKHSDKSLGTIILKPKVEKVEDFETYFHTLKMNTNERNPWFSEFWANVFHCRGAACYNQLYQDLQTYKFKHNTMVVNTINAVMTISHALETVRREICNDVDLRSSPCPGMSDSTRVRRRVFETAPSMAFVGAGLKTIAFTDTGESSKNDIEVVNLQKVYGETVWIPVGTITQSGAVNLDTVKTKVYLSDERNETSIQNIHMQCRVSNNTNQNTAYVMEIPSKSKLSILTMMPVHFQGSKLLECGLLKQDALYHLASLSYMLHTINTNSSVLPGIDLGLIVLDTCSRYSHAFNLLNNFIITSAKNKETAAMQMKFEDVIASLLINVESSDIIAPLLDAQNVSQMMISTKVARDATESNYMNSLSRSSLIQAILSVSHVTRSHSVIVIHGTTPWADLVAQDLHSKIYNQRQFICLAGMFAMHSSNINNVDGAISSTELTARQDIVERLIPGTMIVLVLEDLEDVQAFLEAAKDMDGLIFLLVLPRLNAHFYAGQNVFTMSPSTKSKEEDLDISLNLEEWITATQEQMALLPERWLLEYYSNSNLNNTSLFYKDKANKHIPIPFPKNFKDFVHDSVRAGWTTAKKLHKYLKNYCSKNFTYLSMSECYARSNHTILTKNIRDFLYKESVSVISKTKIITNFDLWIGSEHIGMWDDENGLMIHNPSRIPTFQTNCVNSDCTICGQGIGLYKRNKENVPRRNAQYSWAATLGGLTLFSAFLTILTGLYFLTASALPRNNRNCQPSVLDYLILLGILLLFSSNLSFFLTPSEATCGARRFLPGLSYAIIFSGMFIKVYTTWHCRSSTKFEVMSTYKPANVIMMAIALSTVQVLLAGGWLLMFPPQAYVVTTVTPPVWRCYPQGNFESHLILSFSYDILLLSATVVMALLCFSSFKKGRDAEEKPLYYEANWILLSSILVATIFTFWGIATVIVLSTSQADLASALTQLILGIVLLSCLFTPKIFLYRRLRKNRGSPQANIQPTIYDISHLQPPTIKGMAGISGMSGLMEMEQNQNVCLLQCKKIKESRMWNAKDKAFLPSTSVSDIDLPSLGDDNDDDAESDPTQVIPSSLYSLDMFSNSSASQKNGGEDDDDDEEGVRGEHCEPGTNEFSAAHSSVMFLKRECFPVQETTSYL